MKNWLAVLVLSVSSFCCGCAEARTNWECATRTGTPNDVTVSVTVSDGQVFLGLKNFRGQSRTLYLWDKDPECNYEQYRDYGDYGEYYSGLTTLDSSISKGVVLVEKVCRPMPPYSYSREFFRVVYETDSDLSTTSLEKIDHGPYLGPETSYPTINIEEYGHLFSKSVAVVLEKQEAREIVSDCVGGRGGGCGDPYVKSRSIVWTIRFWKDGQFASSYTATNVTGSYATDGVAAVKFYSDRNRLAVAFTWEVDGEKKQAVWRFESSATADKKRK